jgi:hypothetical protein
MAKAMIPAPMGGEQLNQSVFYRVRVIGSYRNRNRNHPGINRQRHGQWCKSPSQRDGLGMNEIGGYVRRLGGFGRQEFPTERTHYGTTRDLHNGDRKAE